MPDVNGNAGKKSEFKQLEMQSGGVAELMKSPLLKPFKLPKK
jgi:hypothetical protein